MAGWDNGHCGLLIIDISDPVKPVFKGSYNPKNGS
jgi:hypothetical protein